MLCKNCKHLSEWDNMDNMEWYCRISEKNVFLDMRCCINPCEFEEAGRLKKWYVRNGGSEGMINLLGCVVFCGGIIFLAGLALWNML